ncbi:MAG: hypothetical protein CEN90_593 [Parcubacteria group bacterium Licking1014_17]|nr:MAG: hypothetical protein CEN90_593 [Parcubacteria group bacterium Licking1014_17]
MTIEQRVPGQESMPQKIERAICDVVEIDAYIKSCAEKVKKIEQGQDITRFLDFDEVINCFEKEFDKNRLSTSKNIFEFMFYNFSSDYFHKLLRIQVLIESYFGESPKEDVADIKDAFASLKTLSIKILRFKEFLDSPNLRIELPKLFVDKEESLKDPLFRRWLKIEYRPREECFKIKQIREKVKELLLDPGHRDFIADVIQIPFEYKEGGQSKGACSPLLIGLSPAWWEGHL